MFAYVEAGQLIRVSNEDNVEWAGRTIPHVSLLTPEERRTAGIYDFVHAGSVPEYHRPGATTYVIDDVAGTVTEVVAAVPYTLDETKAALLVAVNALCDQKMATLKAGYPAEEVLTWAQQVREAALYQADPTAAGPMLDAMAAERGLGKDEMAARIMTKAALFAALAGQIIGRRQRLEDDIAGVTVETAASVAATITTGWPA
jgi:hypothetical protein